VHSRTWTHDLWKKLYDEYIPGWSNEPELFVRVDNVPDERIWTTHQMAKHELLQEVKNRTGIDMSPDVLTIGFARRATPTSAPTCCSAMCSAWPHRQRRTFAGHLRRQAHPKDGGGKELIHSIFNGARDLAGRVTVVYLQNYQMELALKIIAGVDVWLNTPMRPREASGTSGMKATHNGVPNFSVLDGWWIEGWVEGVTGWSIGPPRPKPTWWKTTTPPTSKTCIASWSTNCCRSTTLMTITKAGFRS
jgi:starch phosphorylase